MSEAGWGDDFEVQPKRRTGLPGWFWACGSGCLLALVAIGIGGYLLFAKVEAEYEKAADIDLQWAELGAVLPFDERPDYVLERAWQLAALGGPKVWFLADVDEGLVAMILAPDGPQGAELVGDLFAIDANESPFSTERFELESGTIELAGRDREVLRFQLWPTEGRATRTKSMGLDMSGGARGAALLVDVGERSTLAVQLMRERARAPITDQEVYAFLAPFRLRDVR